MRSPKKSKSTRRPCPIDIDCELAAAERGKVCPNRDYCENLAKAWRLPWIVSDLRDGTKIMIVTPYPSTADGGMNAEQYRAGFCRAEYLPYNYVILKGLDKPVLLVSTCETHVGSGWSGGDVLPEKYWAWAAIRQGMSYLDFYEADFYTQTFWPSERFETEIDTPYQRCILPPSY